MKPFLLILEFFRSLFYEFSFLFYLSLIKALVCSPIFFYLLLDAPVEFD